MGVLQVREQVWVQVRMQVQACVLVLVLVWLLTEVWVWVWVLFECGCGWRWSCFVLHTCEIRKACAFMCVILLGAHTVSGPAKIVCILCAVHTFRLTYMYIVI